MELGKVLLPQYSSDRILVYQVNGFYVRNEIYVDFTEGGNDLADDGIRVPFEVPKGESWLDDQNKLEYPFNCLHELTERFTIASFLKELDHIPNKDELQVIYDKSHEVAKQAEIYARHNPEIVMDLIKQALDKQPEAQYAVTNS